MHLRMTEGVMAKERKTLAQMAAETAEANGGSKGIACPRCGCVDMRVQHTTRGDGLVVRYRKCRHCGANRSTVEN